MAYHAWQATIKYPNVKFTFTGFSLGGQIVGEAGRYYQKFAGKKAPYCVGLDPSAPLSDGCADNVRLTADSCEMVQVIHSNAAQLSLIPILSGLGTKYKSGKCDYWLNCGRIQKQCMLGVLDMQAFLKGQLTGYKKIAGIECAHFLAGQVYASQLANKCFKGVPCPNCQGACLPATYNSQVGTTPLVVGNSCPATQDYYVKTKVTPNFCP